MMLVVFGGLPGTGKSTISRRLAIRRTATYLRIDVIEQAMRSSAAWREVGPAGYDVANALAASNLANDQTVIADCVNPVRASREGWRAIAGRACKPLIEVEVVCSDRIEHRRRVEQRAAEIDGLVLPTWQDVLDCHYAAWPEPHLVIDTASLAPADAVALLERVMGATAL